MTIRPLVYAVIAALGFGGAVAFIAQGSSSSAIMTMTTMRFTTFIVSLFLLAKYRTLGGLSKKNIPILIVIGTADFIANLFLGVATTKGLVSLAVVLGSLYPIVTALLAFKLLHERLHKIQYVGIVFAITGVAVIAAG
jgi:drug/metabolite transporter (DMT)-like permease